MLRVSMSAVNEAGPRPRPTAAIATTLDQLPAIVSPNRAHLKPGVSILRVFVCAVDKAGPGPQPRPTFTPSQLPIIFSSNRRATRRHPTWYSRTSDRRSPTRQSRASDSCPVLDIRYTVDEFPVGLTAAATPCWIIEPGVAMLRVQMSAIDEAHQPKLRTCMMTGDDTTRSVREPSFMALISAVVLPSQIIER